MDTLLQVMEQIKGICFFSATDLERQWHIPRRLAKIIRQQPGYPQGNEMAVSTTATGEWRLYMRVDGQWMDASLHDMRLDIANSEAAAALGSICSERKAASSAANGRLGGRPPGAPLDAETADMVANPELMAALAAQDDRLAAVVTALHVEGETLAEVAARLGISRERVRQLRAQGLRRLRGIAAPL